MLQFACSHYPFQNSHKMSSLARSRKAALHKVKSKFCVRIIGGKTELFDPVDSESSLLFSIALSGIWGFRAWRLRIRHSISDSSNGNLGVFEHGHSESDIRFSIQLSETEIFNHANSDSDVRFSIPQSETGDLLITEIQNPASYFRFRCSITTI